ncbi:MAG: hypothetical protein PF518_19450 [Spirochaetaceae bacterium]|jgi:5-methyltetrahydrofolate--homocysteine methyltransferase|nr:hypothetical protein [Spirochaetaceae bacterium]
MNIPRTTALTVLKDIPLEEVIELIDWRMFLISWDFRTDEARKSSAAEDVLKDAGELLKKIVKENLLTVDGVVRILPAATIDYDDIIIYKNEKRDEIYKQLPMLRRQIPMLGQCPSLADFITAVDSPVQNPGVDDYMGFFAVTAGKKVEETLKIFPDHDVFSPILIKSLADRLAEAGAEYLHRKVRKELWAYEPAENLSSEEILKEKYRGIRPAPGYPCCPDHTGKIDIFDILDGENNINVRLTESYMMQPAASVCGYIFASEKAKYFPVGKIGEDQLLSYSERKGRPLKELIRWLSVNVND